ncbi:MAG: pseudouridine synthase, partial [Pseudomonadota bacterium]
MILTELSPQNFPRFVLFEDNHLLVVRKPAGLLVQGDRSGRANLLDLAKEYLKIKYHKPGKVFLGLVHRLDRQAAGVMVLARTTKSAGRLSAQFREHTVKKIYWAVVHGSLSPPAGRLEMYLTRSGEKMILVPVGSPGA